MRSTISSIDLLSANVFQYLYLLHFYSVDVCVFLHELSETTVPLIYFAVFPFWILKGSCLIVYGAHGNALLATHRLSLLALLTPFTDHCELSRPSASKPPLTRFLRGNSYGLLQCNTNTHYGLFVMFHTTFSLDGEQFISNSCWLNLQLLNSAWLSHYWIFTFECVSIFWTGRCHISFEQSPIRKKVLWSLLNVMTSNLWQYVMKSTSFCISFYSHK